MKITLKDIINKYDTKINLNNMKDDLKNIVLFSDEENSHPKIVFNDVTLEDIKKPSHSKDKEGYKTYTYNFKDYELKIRYHPSNYRTMFVSVIKPTKENIPEPFHYWNWDYNGKRKGYI